MPYYPDSQVKTNLYTTGDKFHVFDGTNYVGDYYINSRGEAYTGKTPQAPGTDRLYSSNAAPNENPVYLRNNGLKTTETGQYSYYIVDYPYYEAKRRSMFEVETAPLKPIGELNIPTEDDYQVGEFQRYFLKKNNEQEFTEVSLKQYQLFKDKNPKVQWEMYTPYSINWVLVGEFKDVYNLNKNIVMLYETKNKLFGFVTSFNKRFSKFYKDKNKIEKEETTPRKIGGNY